MRVEKLRIEDMQGYDGRALTRLAASVAWEEADRPTTEVFVAVPREFSDQLRGDANALLVAVLLPAWRHGEGRIAVEGDVCPLLLEGVDTAMKLLATWYSLPHLPPRIQPSAGTATVPVEAVRNTASFLSGGVDSMATLCRNHEHVATDSDMAIRRAFFVYGYDLGGGVADQPERYMPVFDDAVTRVSQVTDEFGAALVPVVTNIRHLDDDLDFWSHQFHGAALAAVAHALGRGTRSTLIASTFQIQHLQPWGTHPLLDPCWSTAGMRFIHDGAHLFREQKVEAIARHPTALNNIRVCLNPNFPRGELNCGKCEKCIRTMLALVWCGKMAECAAFPQRDLTADHLSTVTFRQSYEPHLYGRLIPRLREQRRDDLIDVIVAKTRDYEAWSRWSNDRGMRGAIRRLDRAVTGGRLTRLIRRVR